MKEITIIIPDNCELIKDGNIYIVKEKKQEPPRSWEEFCKKYPLKPGEAYIDLNSGIDVANCKYSRNVLASKNWCISEEEAEAFLALMQLRQLRKAWVGEWKPSEKIYCAITIKINNEIKIENYQQISKVLSFPTREMAEDFLECFKDLCETAKILL